MNGERGFVIKWNGVRPPPPSGPPDPEVERIFDWLKDWNDAYWRAGHDPGDEDRSER